MNTCWPSIWPGILPSLADTVLDAIEGQAFMSGRKFRDFMENLEKVATPAEPSEAPAEVGSDTDLEVPQGAPPATPEEEVLAPAEDWREEETAPQKEASPQPKGEPLTATAAGNGSRELISQGMNFLGRLAQTLADEQATRQLVDELTEKDEVTGKTYLKIPVESEDVVKNAMKLLGGVLGKFQGSESG